MQMEAMIDLICGSGSIIDGRYHPGWARLGAQGWVVDGGQ